MENYNIWITFHNDEQVVQYGLKEDSHTRLFASHKDIEGANINHMNPVYSEMVTMWYVWKNSIKSPFVGFNHYRRRFDVKRLPRNGECQVLRIANLGSKTVYEQYAQWHNQKDMDAVLSLLDKKYGDGNEYSKCIRESHVLIPNCCFLMKWSDFGKLCKFLFPLLEDFAALCGISNTNVDEWREKAERDFDSNSAGYQMRVVSFLAERLISSWIANNLRYYVGCRNVGIVHYNTPTLLDAAIRSLVKHTAGCHVYVFDNSDKSPYIPSKGLQGIVDVIDNTEGQIIDFDKELANYPDKDDSDTRKSNYGSAKHCMSVEKLMDIIHDGFVLMDSDVLIKEDIGVLWNEKMSCIGSEEAKHNVPLLMPFLCWLNVPVLRSRGVRYFNGNKMWALSDKEPNRWYDTGAWLLEDVRNNGLAVGYINIWQYVIHFGHGSWRGSEERVTNWLKENKELWK